MDTFVGIDGGATRSVAVVTDAGGQILARVEGGAALVEASDPAAGAAELAGLAVAALERAGLGPPATALCCALAGARRDREQLAVRTAIERLGCARRVLVTTDGEAALEDGVGAGAGILLIAGTGSVAWGRGPDGRTARVGGWGRLLGDEGSGYGVGLAALRAVARACDRRASHTALLDRAVEHAGVGEPEQLIAWAGSATKAEIAALAPAVVAAADSGDEVAIGILDKAARHLADHILAVHRVLGPWPEPPRLAFAGGLLAEGSALAERVISSVTAAGLRPRLAGGSVDAACGAARLARRPPPEAVEPAESAG